MQIDTNIYCLATGKPIANISDDEFGVVLASIDHLPACKRQAHIDRLVLSSMRPSLAWLSVSPESLNALREYAPRELLAYLLNRMYAPIHTDKFGKPLNSEAWFAARRMRINQWQIIESADFGDKLDELLLLLLELDSRFNLAKLQKPQSISGLWNSWHEAFATHLIKQLTIWRNSLVAEQHRLEQRAKAQAEFWSEGNRLTRQAMATQFAKVKPAASVVEKREKASRLKDDVDFLDQLERELTKAPAAPAPIIAAPKKILRFGVKG